MDFRETDKLQETLSDRNIDVLINSVGPAHGSSKEFLDARTEQVDEMIQVNVTAAIHLLCAVLPSMIKPEKGHFVAMGAIASLYPLGPRVLARTKLPSGRCRAICGWN